MFNDMRDTLVAEIKRREAEIQGLRATNTTLEARYRGLESDKESLQLQASQTANQLAVLQKEYLYIHYILSAHCVLPFTLLRAGCAAIMHIVVQLFGC